MRHSDCKIPHHNVTRVIRAIPLLTILMTSTFFLTRSESAHYFAIPWSLSTNVHLSRAQLLARYTMCSYRGFARVSDAFSREAKRILYTIIHARMEDPACTLYLTPSYNHVTINIKWIELIW